jgi:DNA-directed RNA polymerase subunit M/transcription elongation factor TFIIS
MAQYIPPQYAASPYGPPSAAPAGGVLYPVPPPPIAQYGDWPTILTAAGLTPALIGKLQRATFRDGSQVLDAKRDTVTHEVIGLALELPATCDKILPELDPEDLVTSSPTLQATKRAARNEEDLHRPRPAEKGAFTCPTCHSDRISFLVVQLRSADEPMNTLLHCTSCDHHWTL